MSSRFSEGHVPSKLIADQPTSWPVKQSTDLHRGDWILALRADTVHHPDEPETSFQRLVVEHPGAAIVLAIDDQERAVIVRQYRHAVQSRMVEIPAGLFDDLDEDPLICAQRELREEVAIHADNWQHLVTVQPSPGISTETHAIFLATGLHDADRGDFELEHEEADMSVQWVPVDVLLDATLAGRVHDAAMVVAVLAYDALRRRGLDFTERPHP